MTTKNIIIITNYGKKIGMGHYYRGEKIKKIFSYKYKVKHLSFNGNKLNTHKINYLIRKKNKNKYLLIFDVNNLKKNFLNAISKFKNKKIGIDPPFKILKLLNMAWYSGVSKITNSKSIKIFSGKGAIIPNGKPSNEIIGNQDSLIFFTGGNDLKKLGDYLPNKLNGIDKKYKKIWVKSEYSKKPTIENKENINWKIIENKKNFYSKKIKAKIAFCVFGTTFFELAFRGIPTVVHDPYNNPKHIKDLKVLESLNLAIWAKKKHEIPKKINLLLNNKIKHKEISKNLRKFFSEKENINIIVKKINSIF